MGTHDKYHGTFEKIAPKSARVGEKFVQVPTSTAAINDIVERRKTIVDLPAPPKCMNSVAVVLFYTLSGLRDDAISEATGMSEDQVNAIRELGAYETAYSNVTDKILSVDADEVRNLLQAHTKAAIKTLAANLEGRNGVAAAKEILDRTGNRPVDVVEHRHKMEGGLTINVISSDNERDTPIIDITPIDKE